MIKPFREWYQDKHGHPWPGSLGVTPSEFAAHIADSLADYTEELAADMQKLRP